MASILMHREIWSGPRVTGGGTASLQAAIVIGHRPANGQPLGVAPAEGAEPGIARNRSPRGAPTRGRACSKALV
jgi:hypothetical protein